MIRGAIIGAHLDQVALERGEAGQDRHQQLALRRRRGSTSRVERASRSRRVTISRSSRSNRFMTLASSADQRGHWRPSPGRPSRDRPPSASCEESSSVGRTRAVGASQDPGQRALKREARRRFLFPLRFTLFSVLALPPTLLFAVGDMGDGACINRKRGAKPAEESDSIWLLAW